MSAQNPQLLEQAQQHLLQNPELMSQLMNSPAVQGLMSNPDIFREFFLNNSQVCLR
jgi:ubiquilin